MSEPAKIVLRARGLKKVYGSGHAAVSVLGGVDVELAAGERVAVVGASGSGKSTLLHLLGGLDEPTEGSVEVMGQDLMRVNQAARGVWRNLHIGFIYQFHHLLAEFSALENVAMPLLIRRVPRDEAEDRARTVLQEMGLGHRLTHSPGELSGGERQRAAVARALVTSPACVLADEPTGNLDRQTAEKVFHAMLEASTQRGTGFVIVTHDPQLAARADRILALEDGRLAD
ncbi:MAG: lipoprotein-releasing transporter ATP-binding protein LolD [Pseudomonadota bacterium]|jgi:lipoprotein-releasing system ATP-binding protein|uniref:Lipoprotein-releasing system ATP-binding protein LolD n=1 Tax=Candidatus Proximibacter danicus TaxID=2954365 RepID=A0A9D7K0Q9_9PROT|nr:lipoprotein-releasing ABC transporter ATP-binding protein LolD [Candidatus Proximibacter danicus]